MTSAGYEPGSAGYRRITLALFLAGLATFALLYTPQPLLPMLAARFALDAETAALSLSATTVGLAVALLVAGPVSEVVGRTSLMLGSLFAASAVGLTSAVVPSWPLLLTLRLVEGLVLAGLPAVAVAYLSEEIADRWQPRAAGTYVGGTALGGMTGRLVAGFAADAGGWRWGTAAVGILGLACAVAVWALLPRSRGFSPAPATWAHLRASTAAILRDPALLALFGIGATCMGAFVGVFNATSFRLAAEPYALPVGLAGMIYLVYSVGSFTSPFAGRLAGRVGHRVVEPVAGCVMLAGLLLTLATPLWLVVAGLLVFSAGFFAVHGVASGWVAARARRGRGGTGQATAWYLFAYYVGSSAFGPMAGAAWEDGAWPRVVWLTGGLVSVVIGLALLLRRIPTLPTRPHAEEEAQAAAAQ